MSKPELSQHVKREVLCETTAGNACFLLTITDFPDREKDKYKDFHQVSVRDNLETKLKIILISLLVTWLGSFRFRYSFIVKAPRPGDSEGIFSVFESSCLLLLPV